MNLFLKTALAATTLTLCAQAMAQITFYEHDGYRGRTFAATKEVNDFKRVGFNDRASSVIVDRGQWEICDDARFGGHCMVLRQGSYSSLSAMGMNDRISSVRPINQRDSYDNEAPPPPQEPVYEYRRRPNETVYQAPVTSARAVYGKSEEKCWTERQQVDEPRRNNVGGAVVGAILGGVLGHQVGGGRGRDLATAGGAVAGAALGNNVGNDSGGSSSRDVRRCETVPDQTPDSWDVTYNYRGAEHHVQMSTQPGRTIAVNRFGEPRQ